MTFVSLERMPLSEVRDRAARLRRHLTECRPDASGMLIFSRPAVYYLSGAWVNGLLWPPRLTTAAKEEGSTPLSFSICAMRSYRKLS